MLIIAISTITTVIIIITRGSIAYTDDVRRVRKLFNRCQPHTPIDEATTIGNVGIVSRSYLYYYH